jgi:choline-glycine betaine transporter
MADWLAGWTVFYWAWWISWTPFVGMFIARISRGRTIREFVVGVLLVPSVVSLIWFCVFGGAAINAQRAGERIGGLEADAMLFGLLDTFPLSAITAVLVMVLVGIFFVSGADAASIVMGALSERGAIEPSRGTVIFWGVLTGAVAAVMLIIGGGGAQALTGLQNLTIVAALPFALVMVGLAWALIKDLRHDPMVLREQLGSQVIEAAVVSGVSNHGGEFALVVEPESSEATAGRSSGNGSDPDHRPAASSSGSSAGPEGSSR